MGNSPLGHEESDMIEQWSTGAHVHTHTHTHTHSVESGVQYLKPRMSRSKHKSSADIAGTTVLFKALYCKLKSVFFIFCACSVCIV